jgi:hypothetical protein
MENESEIPMSGLDIPAVIRLMVRLMMGFFSGDGGKNRNISAWSKRFESRIKGYCPQTLYDAYRRGADRRLWRKHMWKDI